MCVGTSCGVSILMLLNFMSMKCFLWMPTLFCLKNAGPGSSILIISAITSIGIPKKRIPKNEQIISINLLKKCLYMLIYYTKYFIFTKHKTKPGSLLRAGSPILIFEKLLMVNPNILFYYFKSAIPENSLKLLRMSKSQINHFLL